MNIKQVKYFISVAECKSLSGAAREQDVSVQAISKAMKNFEKDLPAPLLVRSSDGITLTPFGEEFYRRACSTCKAFEELENMAAEGPDGHSLLRVSLCAPAFWHSKRARANMESFFSKALGMDAEVGICEGEAGLEQLRAGSLDAIITIGVLDRPGFDCRAIGTVPAGVCIAKNHPLAQNESVTLAELSDYPALASKRFDRFNESIFVTYQNDGLAMDVVWPNDPLSMIDLFYRRHGVCFMAMVSALGEMLPGSVMVPFAEQDAKAIPICLVSPSQRKTSAYLQLERLSNGC